MEKRGCFLCSPHIFSLSLHPLTCPQQGWRLRHGGGGGSRALLGALKGGRGEGKRPSKPGSEARQPVTTEEEPWDVESSHFHYPDSVWAGASPSQED